MYSRPGAPGVLRSARSFVVSIPFLSLIAHRAEHLIVGWMFWIAFCALAPVPAKPTASLTPEEQTWLQENPDKLVLWYNTDFPPIEFASETGAFEGMGADIVSLVERQLGIVFLKKASNDWNAHLAALESGACAVAPTIVETPERKRYARFTRPYASAPVVIITGSKTHDTLSLANLVGHRVAVVSGYATETYLRQSAHDGIEVVPMPDVIHALRATAFGQVDAYVESIAVAAYYIEKESIPNLRVAGDTPYSFAWSIGISRRYPLLASAVQKALASVPTEKIEAARKQWLSPKIDSGWSPETVMILASFATFVVLLVSGLIVISYILRQRLKEKMVGLDAAREKISQQAELLQLATEVTQAGLWDLNLTERTTFLNKQWFGMLGYPPEDRIIPWNEFRQLVHPDDRAPCKEALEHHVAEGGENLFEVEIRLRQADGNWRWALAKGKTVEWNADGVPTRLIGLNVNIQKIKDAQEETRQSEERFRQLFLNAPIPLALLSPDGTISAINDAMIATFGYTTEDIPDLDHWWTLVHPDPNYRHRVQSEWQTTIHRALANHTPVETREYRVTCRNGNVRRVRFNASVLDNSIIVSLYEVTALREKEAALQESTERLRATLNATNDGILVVSKDFKVIQANRQFYRMWNIPSDLESTNDDFALRKFAANQLEDPAAFHRTVEALYASRRKDVYELAFKDGRVFECYSAPMLTDGQEIGRVWDFRDITARKRAEDAIDFERRQLLSIFGSMREIIYVSDPHTHELIYANQHLKDLVGRDPTGELCYEVLQGLDRPCDFCTNPIILNNGGKPYLWEYHNPTTDIDVDIVDQIIRWPDGRDVRLEIAQDITEKKRTQEALIQSEEKLRSIFEAMTDLVLIFDAEGDLIEIAPTKTELLYRPPDEVLGKNLKDIFPPDKAALFLQAIEKAFSQNTSVSLDYELTIGEQPIWFAATISPMSADRAIWVARDITHRKEAEAEHRKLQDQLAQAQKMEAIGILAGGVAHDFNNMLGAIIGYAQLAQDTTDDADTVRESLTRIYEVAKRSADLTHQLLAFARKDVIEPVVLDINEAVEKLLKMLQRLIGENIELRWKPAPDRLQVKLDPSQLDQILANLCVNARDSIADIGSIAIETESATLDETTGDLPPDCRPGEYVKIAISDDGCGMNEETLAHVFEPFFTTKGQGKGTGLGLSTVYGIVHQNKGFIKVDSKQGRGTTFRIYFPQDTGQISQKNNPLQSVSHSQGETILLVEDDPILLEMSTIILERLGYKVLSADTPSQALQLARKSTEKIHMFLTDVVMPEMTGRELADKLLAIRPGIKHLFMSGYTADVIAHQGVLNEGINFIQKPFSLEGLSSKVRAVLDTPDS